MKGLPRRNPQNQNRHKGMPSDEPFTTIEQSVSTATQNASSEVETAGMAS